MAWRCSQCVRPRTCSRASGSFARVATSRNCARRSLAEFVHPDQFAEYADQSSDKYQAMVDRIGQKMGLTTLRYQRLDDAAQLLGLGQGRAYQLVANERRGHVPEHGLDMAAGPIQVTSALTVTHRLVSLFI